MQNSDRGLTGALYGPGLWCHDNIPLSHHWLLSEIPSLGCQRWSEWRRESEAGNTNRFFHNLIFPVPCQVSHLTLDVFSIYCNIYRLFSTTVGLGGPHAQTYFIDGVYILQTKAKMQTSSLSVWQVKIIQISHRAGFAQEVHRVVGFQKSSCGETVVECQIAVCITLCLEYRKSCLISNGCNSSQKQAVCD